MAKKHVAISLEQKAALRAYYCTDPDNLEHKDLAQWFEQQYGRPIAQSSISEILSNKYSHLDAKEDTKLGNKQRVDTKRQRTHHWPELEAALYQWVLRIEDRVNITGYILQEKATWFFKRIQAYRGQEVPKFSTGWLAGFKGRYRIKEYTKHGEAADVDHSAVEAQMVWYSLLFLILYYLLY
jgi:hypothetical protein